MKRVTGMFLVLVCLFSVSVVDAASVPTIHQVYEAAHSGHLNQAQAMMGEVLEVHPDSGKAHFVLAEILAAEHQFRRAAQELAAARQLAPGLPFEKPTAVAALTSRIHAGLYGEFSTLHSGRSGMGHTWMIIGLFGLCVIFLMVVLRAMRRQQADSTMAYPPVTPANASPYANLQGRFTPMTSYNGGFMSSLKTGLGIGAGMAAGEALVNHFIDGNRPGVGSMMQGPMAPPLDDMDASNNLGGNDFGMNDDSGWSDDSSLGGDDFSGMDDGGGWN